MATLKQSITRLFKLFSYILFNYLVIYYLIWEQDGFVFLTFAEIL